MSVVGVDIGSQNTIIALVRSGGVDVICNEVSDRATPTIISFDPKKRYLGDMARTQQISNFRNTVSQLTCLMGRNSVSISEEGSFQTCELVEKDGYIAAKVNYLGEERIFSDVELMAMFLGKVKSIVQVENKNQAADFVISVPAYFTDAQKRHLIAAAQAADVNCLGLISDVSASALAYGLQKNDQLTDKVKLVAIVDIGFSGMRASIVAFTKSGLEVKATSFDSSLGGRNFDMAMTKYFCKQILEKTGHDVSNNKRALLRIRTACERMKKILSGNVYARTDLDALVDGRDFTMEMQRAEFENLNIELFGRIESCLADLLGQSKIDLSQLDSVEIVGGVTRVPAIKDLIGKIFQKEVSTTLNQDEAAARGAALRCAIESPNVRVKPFAVKDINDYEVKWLDSNGCEQVVVAKGSLLPFSQQYPIGQVTLPLEYMLVYDGGISDLSSTCLGRYLITGPKSLSSPSLVKIEVSSDKNGLVSITKASLFEDRIETATASSSEAASGNTEEVPPPSKKITREYQLDIKVRETNEVPQKTVQLFREQECLMAASDKHAAELDDCRNAIEEYIYEMRGKLDGSLKDFMIESDASKFRTMLNDAESWLFEQEKTNSKDVFKKKLSELKSFGQPAEDRMKEHEERPYAEKSFRQIVSALMEKAKTLPQEDANLLIKECETKTNWLNDQLDSVSKQPLYEKPKLFVSQINQEQKSLQTFGAKVASDVSRKAQEKAKAEAAAKAEALKQAASQTANSKSNSSTATGCGNNNNNNNCCNMESNCCDGQGDSSSCCNDNNESQNDRNCCNSRSACHGCPCNEGNVPSMDLD